MVENRRNPASALRFRRSPGVLWEQGVAGSNPAAPIFANGTVRPLGSLAMDDLSASGTVDRYLAAAQSNNIDALVETLADDPELVSPRSLHQHG